MPIRKTSRRATSGVRLVQVDEVSADGKRVRSIRYRLSTLRPNPPRVIADLALAEHAFDREVIASVANQTVQPLAARDGG